MKQAIIERLKKLTNKYDLVEDFNTSEREIRRTIAEIAKEQPVVAVSHLKGYKIASEPTEIGAVYNSAMELVGRMQELSPRLMPQIKFIAEKAQTTLDKEYSLSKLQEKINDEIKYLKFLNKVIKDELIGELKWIIILSNEWQF